jgi:hypothetical protein
MEELELITLYPADKPPYLGILFTSEFMAQSTNKDSVEQYLDSEYEIFVEAVKGNSVMLHLYRLPTKQTYSYIIKRYDDEKLLFFDMVSKWHQHINFGHVVKENDKLKPVRTLKKEKLYVLKVKTFNYQRMLK